MKKNGAARMLRAAEPRSTHAPDAGRRRSRHALDMETFVPAVLVYLAQKISASASAIYRPEFGVGITDWRIMALLAYEPWIAPVRIAESTGLDKGAVSRSLRDLVKAGLVEVADGKSNQRRLPAALTARGIAVHDRMVKIALARQERLLADLSARERAMLRGFLARMRSQVETLGDGSD